MTRGATEWPWHRPIFPGLGDPSIVGAGAFHYRVRHGNGWDHSALATRTNRSPREQSFFSANKLSRQRVGPLVHLRDPWWAVEVVHPRRTEGAREHGSCRLDEA